MTHHPLRCMRVELRQVGPVRLEKRLGVGVRQVHRSSSGSGEGVAIWHWPWAGISESARDQYLRQFTALDIGQDREQPRRHPLAYRKCVVAALVSGLDPQRIPESREPTVPCAQSERFRPQRRACGQHLDGAHIRDSLCPAPGPYFGLGLMTPLAADAVASIAPSYKQDRVAMSTSEAPKRLFCAASRIRFRIATSSRRGRRWATSGRSRTGNLPPRDVASAGRQHSGRAAGIRHPGAGRS